LETAGLLEVAERAEAAGEAASPVGGTTDLASAKSRLGVVRV
jgi:hypothetical protein